jgi:hypothetical protein
MVCGSAQPLLPDTRGAGVLVTVICPLPSCLSPCRYRKTEWTLIHFFPLLVISAPLDLQPDSPQIRLLSPAKFKSTASQERQPQFCSCDLVHISLLSWTLQQYEPEVPPGGDSEHTSTQQLSPCMLQAQGLDTSPACTCTVMS